MIKQYASGSEHMYIVIWKIWQKNALLIKHCWTGMHLVKAEVSQLLKIATSVQCAPLKLTCFHFSLFSKAAFLHCLLQWHKMHYVPKCTFLQSFYLYFFGGNKNQITFILFFEYCLFRSNRNIIKIHSELSSDEAEKMLSPRIVYAVHKGPNFYILFI